MVRMAVVRESDGYVVNVIEVDPEIPFDPGPGLSIIEADGAGPGDTWDGIKFVKSPPPPDTPGDIRRRRLAALRAKAEARALTSAESQEMLQLLAEELKAP